MSSPPLIINASSDDVNWLSLEILDAEAGREISILHYLIQVAKRSSCEDVFIATDGSHFGEVENFQARKKKLLANINVKLVSVPPSATQLELIRAVETTAGAASLAKGFFFVSAWVLPPRSLSKLSEFHRAAAKKDSTALLTFWPVRTSVHSATSLPSRRRLLVTDTKTSEVLATAPFDQYKVDRLDVPSLVPLQGRWANPPEQFTVRTDLRLADLFYASGELLKLMSENFDFATIMDVVENALAREVKLEGVYVYDKELPAYSKSQYATDKVTPPADLCSLRALSEFLAFDAKLDSDAIQNEGVRSSWKVKEDENVVFHETAKIAESASLSDTLLLRDTAVGEGSKLSEGVVVLEGCVIGPNCNISGRVIVCDSIPASITVTGPGRLRGDGKLTSTNPESSTNPELFHEFDSMPNRGWKTAVKALTDDPSKDPDALLDALYGDEEAAESETGTDESSGDETQDFKAECQAMLMSVIRTPDHLRNIELELRSYRLSAFKSDALVLSAIMPVLLAAMIQLGPRNEVVKLQEFVESSGIAQIFAGFFQDSDHPAVYQAIGDFVQSSQIVSFANDNEDPEVKIKNPILNDPNAFTTICAAFDSEMDHADNLPQWLRNQDSQFFKHSQIKKYSEWVQEEDGDESTDSDN